MSVFKRCILFAVFCAHAAPKLKYLNPTLASKLEIHTGVQITSILAIVEEVFSGADCLSMCYNVKKCLAGSVVLVRNSAPKYSCIMNTQTVIQIYQLVKEVFTSMHFHFDGTINRRGRESPNYEHGSTGCGIAYFPETGSLEISRRRRIIDGYGTAPYSHPWIGAVVVDEKEVICGASLIGANIKDVDSIWVLSSAHCFYADDNSLLKPHRLGLLFGFYDRRVLTPKTIFRQVQHVFPHTFFAQRNKVQNDIALIKLSTKVVFNNYIRPICLPYENDKFINMAACKMCGWGENSVDLATENNDKLTCIQTSVTYDGRTHKENAEALNPEGIGFMFWGGKRRGPYFGDSGGPVECPDGVLNFVFGVLSATNCYSGNQCYTFFVKTEHYIRWIKSYTNVNSIYN